uniref:NADH-ubiquinone oxidoreductase chain 2 n=1 Tax=Microlophus albemarlensis TaxID=184593 RepID=Q68R86_9SAUR|nr:NADH dehydrogenase subunit 2 [Microlophus albemarlensis]AAU01081.1 NADH dehydrogenase subunit 2 [Microlophus albemarlensis]
MSPIASSIIISSLATGTIITASSYHWLMAWVGLEINTLAIIPLISKKHHPRATEASTKYFLTQAAASALILFSSTMNAQQTGTWDITQLTTTQSNTLLSMALAMKLGLAPTHFWLPEVLQGSTMTTALVISTWQKLAPLTLLYMSANNLPPTLLLILGALSTLVGGWGGLNQTQLRKIMAFSSIAHLGWIMTISFLLTNVMTLNLIIYIIMTTTMFSTLILSNLKTIKDTTTLSTTSPAQTTLMALALLSLGGLPPLSGFIPKWLILEELTKQNLIPMALLMVMAALLSLFFYLRLMYTTTMTLAPNTTTSTHKWRFTQQKSTTLTSLTAPLTLLLLPTTQMLT